VDEKANVIVTGSTKESKSAWISSQALLRLYGINAKFFHPQQWNKMQKIDGLLITGGVDVDPLTFHTPNHHSIQKTDQLRDTMELYLLQRAQKENIPVMGICRGMQLINLFMGGTIHPHIPDIPLEFTHPNSLFPTNKLSILPKTRLHKILRTNTLKVNTLHHQTLNKLGEGLHVAAKDKNTLVQAIESSDEHFILGVQWHPEFMPYHWSTHRIFKAFVQEAKKHAFRSKEKRVQREYNEHLLQAKQARKIF